MTRRSRSDSANAILAKAQTQTLDFEWPDDVVSRPNDPNRAEAAQLIANKIWASRTAEDWRPFDPVPIASLAIVQADLDFIQTALSDSNYLIKKQGKGGRTIASKSPLLDVYAQLGNRAASLSRALGLSGTQTDSRTVAANARKQQSLERDLTTPASAFLAQPVRKQ